MTRTSLLLAALAASTLTLTSCDSGEDPPPVAEVFLIGTRVLPDFLSTGTFEIVATPLDEEGASILDADVEGEVTITSPSGTQTSVRFGEVNEVTDDPLAVALTIDESGSMNGTDPQRLRVSGAKDFIARLDETPDLDWESAVYGYSDDTRLLQDYTDDVPLLEAALDRIVSSGGTSTYGALTEVLGRIEDGGADARRHSIVLFSDGQPGDANLREEVCREAVRLGVPIYSIGLGPASDVSDNPDPGAVEEMRAIANCSRAAYAGIASDDPTAVQAIYVSIATAAAQGSLTYDVTLSGPGFESLAAGQLVEGRLRLTNGGESASADFSFTVPAPESARPAPRRGAGDDE